MITLDTKSNTCTEVCIPQKSVDIFKQNQKISENLIWNRGTCSRDDYPVMSGEVQVGGSEVVASNSITGGSTVGGLVGRLYTSEEGSSSASGTDEITETVETSETLDITDDGISITETEKETITVTK